MRLKLTGRLWIKIFYRLKMCWSSRHVGTTPIAIIVISTSNMIELNLEKARFRRFSGLQNWEIWENKSIVRYYTYMFSVVNTFLSLFELQLHFFYIYFITKSRIKVTDRPIFNVKSKCSDFKSVFLVLCTELLCKLDGRDS